MEMKSSEPLISVIIPCYNAACYILEAIDSVLCQTYEDFELIIIDDGSTDNTGEIAKKYSSDSRVLYSYQANAGLSAARNKGIAMGQGSYIALLDADDVWLPEKLDRQMAILTAKPDIGMVFTDFATFDSAGIIASSKLPYPEAEQVTYSRLFERNNFIYPSTVIVRKSVFAECGGFDPALRSIEDYDMWLRIARHYKLTCIPEVLVNIRQHDSNMSTNVARMLENELAVLEKNRNNVTPTQFRKRQAKSFYLAADRFSCQLRRRKSVSMLLKAIGSRPMAIEILIVLIKIMLGGDRIMRLRRYIDNSNNLLGKLYWQLYRRY